MSQKVMDVPSNTPCNMFAEELVAEQNLDLYTGVCACSYAVRRHKRKISDNDDLSEIKLGLQSILHEVTGGTKQTHRASSEGSRIFKAHLSSMGYLYQENADLRAWSREKFNSFKEAAIILLQKTIPTIVELSNDSTKHEVGSLQPVLKILLEKLIDAAFTGKKHSYTVGPKSYEGIIFPMPSEENLILSANTNLSIVLSPEDLCVGGFENKISSKDFLLLNDSKLGSFGKKVMGQCSAQMQGAIQVLKSRGVKTPHFPHIVTNGRTFLYIESVENKHKQSFQYIFPISLTTPQQLRSDLVVAKEVNDESYRQVADILGRMFDNVVALTLAIRKTNLGSIAKLATHYKHKSDEESDDDDDDAPPSGKLPETSSRKREISQPGATSSKKHKIETTTNSSSSNQANNKRTSTNSSSSKQANNKRTALAQINTNVLTKENF